MGRKPVTVKYIYFRDASASWKEAIRKSVATGALQHVLWSNGTWCAMSERDFTDWQCVECTAEEAYLSLPGNVRLWWSFERLFGDFGNG